MKRITRRPSVPVRLVVEIGDKEKTVYEGSFLFPADDIAAVKDVVGKYVGMMQTMGPLILPMVRQWLGLK